MSRDFETADDIQRELADGGVYVKDETKYWRWKGKTFCDDDKRADGKVVHRSSRYSKVYTKLPYSSQPVNINIIPEDVPSDEIIFKLIDERSKCKVERDYDRADKIRDGLIRKYDVFINEKTLEWSIDGDFGQEQNIERM